MPKAARPESVFGETASLSLFHPLVRQWFSESLGAPTSAQAKAWPSINSGRSTLLLAPTGSGKTLAAFLVAINRLMFPQAADTPDATGRAAGEAQAAVPQGVRVLYISPLKALGVDVERNLRSPIAGVRNLAQRENVAHHVPTIGVRSGDTDAAERRQLVRQPPDILITTPESLYLILTSRAASMLENVESVIIDEIHSLVSTKRGAHLFLSLERLEDLRRRGESSQQMAPLQRIGLSATQRPLDEVARLLGGAEWTTAAEPVLRYRDVDIVDASYSKQFDIRIEVPVEDMARLGGMPDLASGPAAAGPTLPSIWPAIHPRLVELIRAHRSTILFTNSRRLAERLSAAINELAEEELALAHHGSIAKETRSRIEDRLKQGQLPALVATSTMELGIDMGAVDLVIQIEAPPSIASGIQRIGRAGHQVGAKSAGIIFPKYRGDLLACSAAVGRMLIGKVESSQYPRNPLDVLAQQLVAMVALGPRKADELFAIVRRAAPFHELPRSSFDGVLDLLSGLYPSDEFAELRPRVTWDRLAGTVAPRAAAQRIAILNAGTIPDRGLYGVYLASESGTTGSRVGELDEEMVFETHAGDVFLLGASSWRVVEITHDRVLVVPAPGEPGRMPFWRGEGPGRPLEFGQAIGELTRRLMAADRAEAESILVKQHGLDDSAATNLVRYLHDQAECTEQPPDDRTLILECFLDEVGDWRIVLLSPFGARVHAPWAIAVAGRLRRESGLEVDVVWADDGIVFRLPEADEPPALETFFPQADEIEAAVTRELGATALFAARFRENAARALLLPRQHVGKRTPLWIQRKRSADLLAVAARYPSFPLILETFRECLRDVFDLPGLKSILRDVQRRAIHVRHIRSQAASPFAASLLFNYTANFIYDGDAPLAERRAATLALDHAQLRELLGDAELRELLDMDAIEQTVAELQRLDPRFHVRHSDGLHELLLHLGELDRDEIAARTDPAAVQDGRLDAWLQQLQAARRVIEVPVAGQRRYAAAEDAARLRDALGIMPPPGLPVAFLESVANPLIDLVSRYARTHGPFASEEVAQRFGLGVFPIRQTLEALAAQDRVVEGEFLPGGRGREWCGSEVLRLLKRRSLARLRKQIEPVSTQSLARLLLRWQGLTRRRRGLDGLLDVIDQLQGAPVPASALERHILPSRVEGYRPSDIDELCAAGEVVWRGIDPLGSQDGRIALYLTDHFARLALPPGKAEGPLSEQIRQLLSTRGALFFDDMARLLGAFRPDILEALWDMVWMGEVTNDTLVPLRSLMRAAARRATTQRRASRTFRSRRVHREPGTEGRWSLLWPAGSPQPSSTERLTALATQLIARYGIVTRGLVASENVTGGFAGIYPVFKGMEEAGKIRRGYFVAGLGGVQFAAAGADDQLRQLAQEVNDERELLVLAATDPANPYGTALPWPPTKATNLRPQRAAGARVILARGDVVGYLSRGGQQLLSFPAADSAELADGEAASTALLDGLLLAAGEGPLLLTQIDGQPPGNSPLANGLVMRGFTPTSRGYLLRSAEHRGVMSKKHA